MAGKMEFYVNTQGFIIMVGYITMCIGFLFGKVNGYILFIITLIILLIKGYGEKSEDSNK